MPNPCKIYDGIPELGGKLLRVWTKPELEERADLILRDGFKRFHGKARKLMPLAECGLCGKEFRPRVTIQRFCDTCRLTTTVSGRCIPEDL